MEKEYYGSHTHQLYHNETNITILCCTRKIYNLHHIIYDMFNTS